MNRPAEAPPADHARETTREAESVADPARPAARTLHVQPTPGGRWAVCYSHGEPAVSDHLTANEAQYFAKQRARTEGIEEIVVHDAYLQVHAVPILHPSSPGSNPA
jgi:hypothetical protein